MGQTLRFPLFAGGDVARGGVNLASHINGSPLDPAVGAVLATVAIGEIHQLLVRGQQSHCLFGRGNVFGVNEIDVWTLFKLFDSIAESILPGGVQPEKTAAQARDTEKVLGEGEVAVKFFGLSSQLFFGPLPLRDVA